MGSQQFSEYEEMQVPRIDNSTFLLTKSPQRLEEMRGVKGSDVMYEKIDSMIKDLMKNIQDKCERMEQNIERIIKDAI